MTRDLLMMFGAFVAREPARGRARRDQPRHRAGLRADGVRGDDRIRAAEALSARPPGMYGVRSAS